LYCEENRLGIGNAVERTALPRYLAENAQRIGVVVLVDDFLGSGETVVRLMQKLVDECGGGEGLRPFAVHVVAVCAFPEAMERVEECLAEHGLDGALHVCDPLGNAGRCFGHGSAVFPDAGEREEAAEIAREHGGRLAPRMPLGFDNGQAVVVFESSCPNNSLPILWSTAKGWKALFPRAEVGAR
jgi:hypothetical protein